MIYCDTSVLVSAISDETNSKRTRVWLRKTEAEGLVASDWAYLEAVSALGLKKRSGALDDTGWQTAHALLQSLRTGSIAACAVLRTDYEAAEVLCRSTNATVRGADALHIAVCSRIGARSVTLDVQQERAAIGFGLETISLEPGTA